jgi:hypothetical protein
MNLKMLLDKLGYSDSPNYLERGSRAFESAPDYGHIFRHAAGGPCRLRGVYGLRPPNDKGERIVPIVYVCEADGEQAADKLHRLVWNQDVVPFILICTPTGVKIHSGFRYEAGARGEASGVLRQLTSFNQIGAIIDLFEAESIDDGKIWKLWGDKVTPEHRVYWKLLGDLQKLDTWLRDNGLPDKEVRHALIGKYVYLHYLRDREILSLRKFGAWNLDARTVFGPAATRSSLEAVVQRLDDWLNGRVFPLRLRGPEAPSEEHIKRVAATFAGEEPIGDASWQLHLDFKAYNFSYIPIETLSMIYEQFLHLPEKAEDAEEDEGEAGEHTRGRKAGAYYTPIPVVNFMLAELDERHPLRRDMKVFDPACGSGAFLVQCYRRLVEREFLAKRIKPTPHQLKSLLASSIFGADYDADACSVTELSLVLTLLDYVEPPDLEGGTHARFKLPLLRGNNIFKADFFLSKRGPFKAVCRRRFDWVVGNPPWKRLDAKDLEPQDKAAWQWMRKNSKRLPVAGNQLAQAFAWECRRYVRANGSCALLMPAMSLFEESSRAFRAEFFRMHRVHTVANFANLAEVLFAGRSRVPAAAFFFAPRPEAEDLDQDEFVTTFSPLVANQEATRPLRQGTRNESWSLTINASEVREIPTAELIGGSGLPWKLATWGSAWDSRLLARLSRKWPSLGSLEAEWDPENDLFQSDVSKRVFCASGLQLRSKPSAETEPVNSLGGQKLLVIKELKRLRHIFNFPPGSLKTLDKDAEYHALKGRVDRALRVCKPPHVVVGAARNFAVYTDRFLVVPARQIGVVSPIGDKALLKALSLFLSSDFMFYHQFLTSSQFGVQRGVATLNSLRQIPVPLAKANSSDLEPWVELHTKLAKTKPRPITEESDGDGQLDLLDKSEEQQQGLLTELNELVAEALGLDERERLLVHDLVHVQLALNDGKLGDEAMANAKHGELETYGRRLQRELDDFINGDMDRRHAVAIEHDELSGMVEVNLTKDVEATRKVSVLSANRETASALEKTRRRLRRERAQWVYFDRNLRIYEGRRTYILKPMHRFHWTESRAIADASEIIAETLAARAARA